MAVKLSARNVFLSDLAFYRSERRQLVRETFVDGVPDLVVEALSPTTGERDVSVKFVEYEQHGVGEYWVLDPETLAHRFYAREGELLVEFARGESPIPSRTIRGFHRLRDWLDPTRLPAVGECLRTLL